MLKKQQHVTQRVQQNDEHNNDVYTEHIFTGAYLCYRSSRYC